MTILLPNLAKTAFNLLVRREIAARSRSQAAIDAREFFGAGLIKRLEPGFEIAREGGQFALGLFRLTVDALQNVGQLLRFHA